MFGVKKSCSPSLALLVAVLSAWCPSLSAAGRVLRANSLKITPALKPEGDAHFFGKDFPDDHSPRKRDKFSHPYPELQDDNKYDKDYVHDRDDDGGEWKAQMEYDNLRSKIGREKWEAEQAAKKEAKEKADVEAAKKKEEGAEEDAKKAESDVEAAEGDKDKVAADGEPVGTELEQAQKELKKAQEGMEKCKDRLAKAEARIKELESKNNETAANVTDAKAKVDKAEEKAAAVEKDEEKAEKSLEQEIKEYEAAKKEAAEEKDDLGKHEDELAAAEKKLRQYRGADNGSGADGGVYNDSSGGLRWWHWLLIIVAIAALVAVGAYCFMGR